MTVEFKNEAYHPDKEDFSNPKTREIIQDYLLSFPDFLYRKGVR
jgi:hypothetical protein